jgi:hypothetical protein
VIGAAGNHLLRLKRGSKRSETPLLADVKSEIKVCKPLFFEVNRSSGLRTVRSLYGLVRAERARRFAWMVGWWGDAANGGIHQASS